MKPITLIPANTSLDFLGKKWGAFILSAVLIVTSFGLLFTKGLNFGIDFTGGIVIEIRTENPVEIGALRQWLNQPELGEVALQTFGSQGDLMIRLQAEEDETSRLQAIDRVKTILADNLQTAVDYRKVEFVGPQVGSELIRAGALSLLLAFAAILIYIWMRFEWQFGVGAVAALIHDVILTLGLFSLLQLEFNLTSIAAILTIVGYSINDSVVIFDRIRENLRKFKKMQLPELLNNSINDNLARTVMTSGTTTLALVALVWMGGEVIKGFSIAVLFGIVIGTYSSIYIASPLLIFMNLRHR